MILMKEEGPLHHALHDFFLQGYVDFERYEDVRRAGVQFLDVFKRILTNNIASAHPPLRPMEEGFL